MRDVVEIGLGKTAQRGYHLDDIAIVPEPPHPRRRRRLDGVAARRVPLQDPVRGAPERRHDEPGLGGGAGPPRRPRRAQRRGPVDPLRGPDARSSRSSPTLDEDAPATRRLQEVYAEPIQPELIAERVRQIREGGVTVAVRVSPAAHARAGAGHPRRGRRHPRHPGHDRLGRARLDHRRAAQPQGVHRRPRPAGHRRRLHRLQDGAAPDAYRRRRRDRRRRRRRVVHHRHRARHPGADGHRDRRRGRRPARLPRRDRRPLRPPDRRRRPADLAATSPRRWAAAPTR